MPTGDRATGGTPKEEGVPTVYYLTRNRLLYAPRAIPGLLLPLFFLWFFSTRAAKVALAVLHGRLRLASLIARATVDGLCGRTGAVDEAVIR